MRAPIALILIASTAAADPALSADGRRIELQEHTYRLCGGSSTVVFCDAGADVDERCKRFEIVRPCHIDDDVIDDTPAIEQSIADTRAAGSFKTLPVIALHQIREHEMLGPQEIVRARVTKPSRGLTITVAAGKGLSASITVARGKRTIAKTVWVCRSYGGDQTAITGAVIVGDTVYAQLTCSTYNRWLRVSG